MFTSLVYKGKEYQFKSGHDLCETFNLGDEVPSRPVKDRPERIAFEDGVYRAFTQEGSAWIIIKNHKFLEIVEFI